MSKMPIIIIGASGRMGRMLIDLVQRSTAFELRGLIERAGHADVGRHIAGVAIEADLESISFEGAGVIDFSGAGAPEKIAPLAARAGSVYVVGATALTKGDKEAIERAAQAIAVIASENMSYGIALLSDLVERAARLLSSEEWDIEIHDIHHRGKKDAPSGTAFLLGRAAARGRGKKLEEMASFTHQDGRKPHMIGFSSARGGNDIGTHHVSFLSEDESLTFIHRANSREIFAQGALRACLWGRDRAAGLYDMRDVLGL